MGRGQMTDKLYEMGKAFFKDEFTVNELRLIPYVQYIMVNNQKLEPKKLNDEDWDILEKWEEKGFINSSGDKLRVTKTFWDFMKGKCDNCGKITGVKRYDEGGEGAMWCESCIEATETGEGVEL